MQILLKCLQVNLSGLRKFIFSLWRNRTSAIVEQLSSHRNIIYAANTNTNANATNEIANRITRAISWH